MTTRLAGAMAAGALAIGILVGAAGTVVVNDVAQPTPPMGQMGAMGAMGAMGDMARMQAMMSTMGGGAMGPGGSMSAGDHARHHAGSAP